MFNSEKSNDKDKLKENAQVKPTVKFKSIKELRDGDKNWKMQARCIYKSSMSKFARNVSFHVHLKDTSGEINFVLSDNEDDLSDVYDQFDLNGCYSITNGIVKATTINTKRQLKTTMRYILSHIKLWYGQLKMMILFQKMTSILLKLLT